MEMPARQFLMQCARAVAASFPDSSGSGILVIEGLADWRRMSRARGFALPHPPIVQVHNTADGSGCERIAKHFGLSFLNGPQQRSRIRWAMSPYSNIRIELENMN